jgi:tetratricopeptide (TPR) repeat protein
MAPEQASGKSDAVSVASDVYSLGAILYELLAGRPPFRGETPWDTLRHLAEVEPARVRSLNPAVDRDLETICHKCLQKDPAQRYANAADLAGDLERYQCGEPILARPVSRGERLWRWCRRNPALSAVSALAVLALVTVAIGGVLFGLREANHAADMEVQVQQTQMALQQAEEQQRLAQINQKKAEEQQRLAQENQKEAEKQKKQADESFLDAHQAVYKFTSSVSTELSGKPEWLPLRKKLLDSALDYYKKFLKQRADDPKLERELADASFQMAHINQLLGSPTKAIEGYEKALALYQKIYQNGNTSSAIQHKLASTQQNLGTQQQKMGKYKEAQAVYAAALKLYRELAEADPKNAHYPDAAASVGNNLASLYADLGDHQKSLEMFREVVADRKKQLAADPDNLHILGLLALNINNMGVTHANMGNNKDALQSFQEALDLRLKLVKANPKNPYAQIALAASYRDVGMAQLQLGQNAVGIKSWEKALEIREKITKDNPAVGFYQSDLAGSYQDFGQLYENSKKYQQAFDYYAKAHAIWVKLLKVGPDVPSYQVNLARCDYHLAKLCGHLKKHAEEWAHYELAVALQEKLVQANPQQATYHWDLAQSLHDWGLALGKSGDAKKAEDTLRLAVKHQKIAYGMAPAVTKHRKALSDHIRALCNVLVSAGRWEEALELTLERRQLWQKHAQGLYNVATDLARTALGISDPKWRGRYEDEAVATLELAVAAGYKDAKVVLEDPAWQPLLSRADVKTLLSKLPK